MHQPVDYQNEHGIVTITLNRPEKRNGLSPQMVDGLIHALERLSADAEARCAVLTGAGSTFSAGGDPKRMLEPGLYPDMTTVETVRFYQQGIQRLPLAFSAVDVPIVAAVNGPAIGAGCDLICLCDIRIASSNAKFASSFVKLGLVPGDGGAWLLPRIVGLSNASEMMLTGDAIDARAALAMGLVSSVVEPDNLIAEAYKRARSIAANPPHGVRLTKRLIAECEHLTLPGALQLSANMQALCHKMSDHREAVTAVIEKRAPQFTGK